MAVRFGGTWSVIYYSTAWCFPSFDVAVEPQWDIFRSRRMVGRCWACMCRAVFNGVVLSSDRRVEPAGGEMSSSCVLNRFSSFIDSSPTRVVTVASVSSRVFHVHVLFNKHIQHCRFSPSFGTDSHAQGAGQVTVTQKSIRVILWANLGEMAMYCDAAEFRLP